MSGWGQSFCPNVQCFIVYIDSYNGSPHLGIKQFPASSALKMSNKLSHKSN
jgi:hypothetical protein